jgi:hypothetical protein
MDFSILCVGGLGTTQVARIQHIVLVAGQGRAYESQLRSDRSMYLITCHVFTHMQFDRLSSKCTMLVQPVRLST